MEMLGEEGGRRIRRTIYLVLALTALGSAAGRILAVKASTGETPMLSANDRSRWCTIAALVDHGTYQIDQVIQQKHPDTRRRHWYTIDMVKHRGRDGREHFYSSKPPLLPTLLAAEYWCIKHGLGLEIARHPEYVMRMMLLLTNGGLLVLLFVVLADLVETHGQTDWGKCLAFAVVTWGTFLTTFAVTLNNHLPAAVAVAIAAWLAIKIRGADTPITRQYFAAGLASGFAVANELPSLAFLVMLGLWLFRESRRAALIGFVPGACVVAMAFFGANIMAHDTWKPAYAHRQDGEVLAHIKPRTTGEPTVGSLRDLLEAEGITVSRDATIQQSHEAGRWILWDRAQQLRLAIVQFEARWEVRAWGNWYEYPRSYWNDPQGIDRGERTRLAYLFHTLVGHHGMFSLTPIWFMAAWGVWVLVRSPRDQLWPIAVGALVLTLVCTSFYVARPLKDRNYGGVTCGFRWLFWLIPLWTTCLVAGLDRVASNLWGRLATYLALLMSILTASYAAMNPWSHPWIYDFWVYLGWVSG